MGNENQLYSISLGVASLQGGLVGIATALSPATCRPFQVFSPSFFVGLELTLLTVASSALQRRWIKVRWSTSPERKPQGSKNLRHTVFRSAFSGRPSLRLRLSKSSTLV